MRVQPSSENHGERDRGRETLSEWIESRPAREGYGEQESGHPARGKPEKMGGEVDSGPAAAEHRDDREGCTQRDPCPSAGQSAPVALPCGETREYADQSEDARRRSDRTVSRTVVQRIRQIAERSRHDETEERDADAQPPRDRREKEASEKGVAQNMRQVGVKGERGEQAPPLTFEYQRGLTPAEFQEIRPAAGAFEPQMKGEEAECAGVCRGHFEGRRAARRWQSQAP